MKKIHFCFYYLVAFSVIFALQSFSNTAKAQANLQYNQTISQTLASVYTVPTGKTFKLESVAFSTNVSATADLTVNGFPLYKIHTLALGTTQPATTWPFPVWFKAGDVISAPSFGNLLYITGIEFNIVP